MNPGKMRNTYGKLMWILMDTESYAVKEKLQVSAYVIIYICVYICIQEYACINESECMYVYVYMCMYTYTLVRMHASLCVTSCDGWRTNQIFLVLK